MSQSSSDLPAPTGGDFILYTAPDGAVKVDVFFKDETVWLTQKALAELFGVKRPIVHVMGYFTAVLRERIANFEAPPPAPAALSGIAIPTPEIATAAIGVSINDLRKNLRDINEHMDRECKSSEARYGIALDASLITGIDPPGEVESALAAINTAYNQVSSEISLAQARADQKIVQSKTAVEIETLKAQTEVGNIAEIAQFACQEPLGVKVGITHSRYVNRGIARPETEISGTFHD